MQRSNWISRHSVRDGSRADGGLTRAKNTKGDGRLVSEPPANAKNARRRDGCIEASRYRADHGRISRKNVVDNLGYGHRQSCRAV